MPLRYKATCILSRPNLECCPEVSLTQIVVSLVVTPPGLVPGRQLLERICCLHFQDRIGLL